MNLNFSLFPELTDFNWNWPQPCLCPTGIIINGVSEVKATLRPLCLFDVDLGTTIKWAALSLTERLDSQVGCCVCSLSFPSPPVQADTHRACHCLFCPSGENGLYSSDVTVCIWPFTALCSAIDQSTVTFDRVTWSPKHNSIHLEHALESITIPGQVRCPCVPPTSGEVIVQDDVFPVFQIPRKLHPSVQLMPHYKSEPVVQGRLGSCFEHHILSKKIHKYILHGILELGFSLAQCFLWWWWGKPAENTERCAVVGSVFCHSWGHYGTANSKGRLRKF
jgi:hypothetical protein